MSHSSVFALLQAARDFIADIPPLALLNAPRRTGRKLVTEIDRALAATRWSAAPPDIIEAARGRWHRNGVRIDDDAMLRTDAEGSWISAWVLAGPAISPISTTRFRAALDALPVMQREVYIMHRVEDRSLSSVAERLGLTIEATEKLLLDALRGLHLAIYSG